MAAFAEKQVRDAIKKLKINLDRLDKMDFVVSSKDVEAMEKMKTVVSSEIVKLELLVKQLDDSMQAISTLLERMEDGAGKTTMSGTIDAFVEEMKPLKDQCDTNLITLKTSERTLFLTLDEYEEDEDEEEEEEGEVTIPSSVNQQDQQLTTAPRVRREKKSLSTRLPRQEIPSFDGTGEWRQFWARFRVTVDKQKISSTEKLVFLIGALRGAPLKLVEGYAINNEAYGYVVKTLQEEYGDRGMQITRLHTEMQDVKPAKEDTASAHRLLNDLQRLTRQLTALGESVDHPFIETAIHRKLPSTLMEKVLRKKAEESKFTVSDQLEFLVKEVGIRRQMEELEKNRNPSTARANTAVTEKPRRFENRSTEIKKSEGRGRGGCFLCEGSHRAMDCPLDVEQRRKKASERRLCFKCLRTGHQMQECQYRWKCRECSDSDHNTLLCRRTGTARDSKDNRAKRDRREKERHAWTSTGAAIQHDNEKVILLTQEVKVINPATGREKFTTVFLDNGADLSFISEELVKDLGLQPIEVNSMKVTGFLDHQEVIQSGKYRIQAQKKDGGYMDLILFSSPHMAGAINRIREEDQEMERPSTVKVMPGILIGSEHFWEIFVQKDGKLPSGLHRIKTVFGRMGTGSGTVSTIQTQTKMNEVDDEVLAIAKKFFAIESVGVLDDPNEDDEEEAQAFFDRTVKRGEDGRISVRLPFKSKEPDVADNRTAAIGQLKAVVRRLEELGRLEDYDAIFKGQLEEAKLEVVKEEGKHVGVLAYLPHHPVINMQKKSTKIRIVFNASAGPKGRSLNKALYQGSSHLPHAAAMILRMRMRQIVVTADITKAYLQVGLQEEDRDAVRLFWLKDFRKPVTTDNLLALRFTRVPFGVISSPHLLASSIRKLLDEEGTELAAEIKANVYADNLLIGARTAEEALLKMEETKKIFDKALMPLREWTCNDPIVHAQITDAPGEENTKFLGIGWNVKTDELTVSSMKSTGRELTKTTVLSETMSNYDPMGYISPALLPARRFMQKIVKMLWKDPLPAEDQEAWNLIASELANRELTIPRFIMENQSSLHVFTDASVAGYGCCVYLRSRCEGGWKTYLLMAKAKVVPSSEEKARMKENEKPMEKRISIPRLELLAAELGAKVLMYVKKELGTEVVESVLWTDSLPALSQIIQPDKDHKKYVANRVAKINEQQIDQFRYVPTFDNPADIASRGCTFDELKSNPLWWRGPSWLCKDEDAWPTIPHGYSARPPGEETGAQNEVIEARIATVTTVEVKKHIPLIGFEQIREYSRMQSVAAWALRFARQAAAKAGIMVKSEYLQPHKEEPKKRMHTVQERQIAERLLIAEYTKEYPPEPQIIKNYGLEKDGETWRAFGRLVNAPRPGGAVCPFFLDPRSELAKIAAQKAHEERFHAGEKDSLAQLRRSFWIPRSGRLIHTTIFECKKCKRERAQPFELPTMPPLPIRRVTRSRPFQNCGVDFMGPITINTSRGRKKTWVCLWTCMVTRACHLEIVGDLSTASYILAMRRFIARRGRPDYLLSDHGTNFVGAEKATAEAWKNTIEDDEVMSYLSKEAIEWKMITPRAPWRGGLYERLIGMTKKAFNRIVGKRILNQVELHVVLTEIEALLNTRPLVQVSDEGDVLRPIDLISPCLPGVPRRDPTTFQTSGNDLKELWTTTTELLDAFWLDWQDHYLPSLRETHRMDHRHPRSRHARAPRVGEVVLVVDNLLPRGDWKPGVVVELITSKGGEVRSAIVRMPNRRLLERAVNHLLPLEITDDEEPKRPHKKLPTPKDQGRFVIGNDSNRKSNDQGKEKDDQEKLPAQEESRRAATHCEESTIQKKGKKNPSHSVHHSEEPKQSGYNLRPRNALMIMTIIMALFSPAAANQCLNNTAPKGAKIAYAEDCLPGGGPIVYQNADKRPCFVEKACKKDQHLRVYSTVNVTCGEACTCPSWSSGCSHYRGVEADNSTLKVDGVKELLNRLAIKDVCGFEARPECDPTPHSRWINVVELYDGVNQPVSELNLRFRDAADAMCIGEGKTQSGTKQYCTKNTCTENATIFCAVQKNEVVYLRGGDKTVAVRAWGGYYHTVYNHRQGLTKCNGCSVECTKGGIVVKSNGKPRLLEACARNHCARTEDPEETESVVFPHGITVSPYRVQLTLYKGKERIYEKQVDCPAGSYCEQIPCIVCWELATNLQCAPRSLIIGLAVFLYFATAALTILVNCCFICTGMGSLFFAVGRALVAILRWMWKKMGPGRRMTRAAEIAPRRPRHRGVRALQWSVLIICLLAPIASGCDEATTIQANQESCTREEGRLVCSVEDAVQWPSIGPSETVCLQIADAASRPMATVEIQLKEITLQCEKETLFLTHPYRSAVASSKRCPSAGSCQGNRCSQVRDDDVIPELGEAALHPGFTACSESCGCAGCGCFWCSPACLFYRPHFVLDKSRRYEVFHCPTWKQVAHLVVTKIDSTRTQEHQVTLSSGGTEELEELHVQLSKMDTPPSPVLNQIFITDGRDVATVENVDALRCLQCNATSCVMRRSCCQCTTFDELASCTCTSGSTADDTLNSFSLPRFNRFWMKVVNRKVTVEANETRVELQASLKRWKITPVADLETCSMEGDVSASGCHSCREGAVVSYSCRTTSQHAVGHVQCGEDIDWNVECSPDGLNRTTRLVVDRAHLDLPCRLRCGTKETTFKLIADLALVALAGKDAVETARQSIPIIVRNVFDLAFSQYQYLLILIVSLIVIVVVMHCRPTHRKRE